MFVNRALWTTPDLPFSGIKNSGYGRETSSFGIQEFVNKKAGACRFYQRTSIGVAVQ